MRAGTTVAVMCGALLAVRLAVAGTAVVIDKEGVEVHLSKVTTTHILVEREESGAMLKIPVAYLASILLAEGGKTLVFTTIENKEVRGTTSDSISGEWELGKYTVRLSKIKSVRLKRSEKEGTLTTRRDQPDGFVATCTDTSGTATEVYRIHFNFGYSYPPPGVWVGFPPPRSDLDNPRAFLPLEVGQLTVAIPFSRIQSVSLESPDPECRSATPNAKVVTKDGKSIVGKVAPYGEHDRRITGNTDLGEFSLTLAKVARLEFHHDRDKNPTTERLDRDRVGSKGVDSGLTIHVRTWGAKEYVFADACVFLLKDGHKWLDVSTSLSLRIGESQNDVPLENIKGISFSTEGELKGTLTTTTGTSVSVSSISGASHIGGKVETFGPAYLEVKKVKAMDIVK